MLHWIAHLVTSLSYWGVAILMAVENIVLPIPSELIMPLAGFRTERDQMTLLGVILAGTAGSVLGALPLYYAGYALGEDRLRKWIERYGKWVLLRGKDLDRATERFSRWAPASSCAARYRRRRVRGMEDRITPGLYLEMTDRAIDEYARDRVPDVLAHAGVVRCRWRDALARAASLGARP